ncbi:MAG: IS5 family transposase [Bacteroidetes bacterium]|nr:IS5 family transposase [Bacteroidota bacterium]
MVEAILYRLKTGCQWRQLPMKQFFRVKYKWQAVYYHFQKWSKDGSWENVWTTVLNNHKDLLDMSSVQLDGTHTPSKRGGEAVDYQGRKKCKTTNLLIIADNQGVPLACSDAISGNHNDAYELKENVQQMLQSIEASDIATEGLFLNADSGFDSKEFREYCVSKDIVGNIVLNPRNGSNEQYLFDALLYKCRFVIERTNAWLDAFKALLTRFETNKIHWRALNLLAFTVILLRRL